MRRSGLLYNDYKAANIITRTQAIKYDKWNFYETRIKKLKISVGYNN